MLLCIYTVLSQLTLLETKTKLISLWVNIMDLKDNITGSAHALLHMVCVHHY